MNSDIQANSPVQNEIRNKIVAKQFSQEDVREILLKEVKTKSNKDHLLTSAVKALNEYHAADPSKRKELGTNVDEKLAEAYSLVALETHHLLADSVAEKYAPYAIELSNQLNQEYCCESVSERMLVETIVSAYIRILEYSYLLKSNLFTESYISQERNGMYAVFSKELDRSNRQYLQALMTLRQFKAPKLEVNIRAKNAFISQNQQINSAPVLA